MAEHTIKGTDHALKREALAAYINTGTKANPIWSLLGVHTEDSSIELDWASNTKRDITGRVWSSLRKPVVSQTFDSSELDPNEAAMQHIWNLAIVKQDAQALANQDLLIVHAYGDFAERYDASTVEVTSIGGEGGGDLITSTTVTYGGDRTEGTVTVSDGTITFVPDAA